MKRLNEAAVYGSTWGDGAANRRMAHKQPMTVRFHAVRSHLPQGETVLGVRSGWMVQEA